MSTSERRQRASIPILERYVASLSSVELDRLHDIAQKYLRNEPALTATDAFGPLVHRGLSDGPALLIGDQSEIPLYPRERAHVFEYRMGLLAQDGDFIALTRRNHSFESYLCELLGADHIGAMLPEPGPLGIKPMSLTERCENDPAAISQLSTLAARQGGLSIIPYLATGRQWRLAAAIATASSAPIHVCAAPPRLSRRVNDKTWFSALARGILGRSSIPPTFTVFGPAAAAGRALAIARTGKTVIIKVPSSAGSIGNIVLGSDQLLDLRSVGARELIMSLLKQRGWAGTFPVLVGVWEAPVFTSPSVQTWIPLMGTELPIVDGIFEQQVKGPRGSFIGAVPAALPSEWLQRLTHEAMKLATVLQALGYFGRCSFDAVLAGSSLDNAELHWIECNGRWGGVSVPMTLANRLTGGKHGGLTIVQASGMDVPSRSMSDIKTTLGRTLFPLSGEQEGIVILSPTVFEMGTGPHFMAIARTQAAADAMADAAFQPLSH